MLTRCPACNSENILIGSATSDCLSCEHSWITERAARLRLAEGHRWRGAVVDPKSRRLKQLNGSRA